MSKLFDQKRSLFGKSFDSGEARDQDGKWSTGGGAPPSKAEKPKRSGSKARETTRALFQANEEAKRAGPSGSPANTAVYNRALSHIDPTELAAATRRAQREEDRNDRPVKKRDEDDLAFSMGVEIFKAIDGAVLKDGIVWGWASIIEKDGKAIIDHQGDMIDPEELVKAAHDFISNSRTGGLMHTKEANEPRKVGDIVESMVFTRELQKALDIDLGKAGWLIGFKITDPEVRKLAAGGRLPSFSIGGIGHREEMRDGE
jgi:hypothetical protein